MVVTKAWTATLAIAREQQQSRETARGKKSACDPRRLVIYEYTPKRLSIGLEKRSRIMLMMARWKYEPYAWSRKTNQAKETTRRNRSNCLGALTQLATMGEPSFIFRERSLLPVCLLPTKALCLSSAALRCSVYIAGIPGIWLQLLCTSIAIPAKQRLSNTNLLLVVLCCNCCY